MLEGRKIYEKRLIQKLFTYTDSEEKTNLCEKLQDARKQGFMMEKYAAMRMVYLDHNLDVEIQTLASNKEKIPYIEEDSTSLLERSMSESN